MDLPVYAAWLRGPDISQNIQKIFKKYPKIDYRAFASSRHHYAADNRTACDIYNILDLFGLSKFKGGQCPPAPPLIKISLRTVGGTKFRTYLTINPDLSGHRMYTHKTADVPDRDRVSASRLRLSSHRLAVETIRWSRKPPNERLCLCGDVQTEEHVICFCPRMALARSRFDEIRFTSIADFFGCDDVRSAVCRMCTLALRSINIYLSIGHSGGQSALLCLWWCGQTHSCMKRSD